MHLDPIPLVIAGLVGLSTGAHPAAAADAGADTNANTTTAVDWSTIRCDPDDPGATLPTPSYNLSNAVFTTCAEDAIDGAAPADVYAALVDYASYPVWNTFVVDVRPPVRAADVYVGMPMTFTTAGVVPPFNTTSDEVVTVLQGGEPVAGAGGDYLLVAWRSNVTETGVLITAEHVNILLDNGNGTTYVSYETYYKEPYVGLVELLKPGLQKGFDAQGTDLKAYVESLV